MAIINLRDYYPFYTSDCFMEVSEEVAEMFKEFDRKEAAYRLRTYRHKAYYSLDRDDGLEHEAVFVALSPHELYHFILLAICHMLFIINNFTFQCQLAQRIKLMSDCLLILKRGLLHKSSPPSPPVGNKQSSCFPFTHIPNG